MMNVSKMGNTKSFSETIYCAAYWVNKKYMVLFSLDFKYKVDSFNLYIIENNYVKGTTNWGVYHKLSNFLRRNHW